MAERRLSIVPETLRETFASAPPRPGAPLELVPLVPPPPHRGGWLSRWPKRIFILFVCLWLIDAGASLLIRYTGLQRKLTARLSAAFGRPVEVDRYNFSLWTGPVLEAQSVTVGEDVRFGNEYFVRADSVEIHLRLSSLLRGHLALGTLSLSQPSVNIVRNASGDWNLAEWLPHPNSSAPGVTNVATAPRGALPFERIEIDGGRMNFKVTDEKLPFAFVNVNGTVTSEPAGRWRIDLLATPYRVATLTQQAGELHIAGRVGGTSSRLLPAAFDATWSDTSVSDALRLTRGNDFGIRGDLSAAVSASSTNGQWILQTRAEMRQLHRWNLALRPDNPDLNFTGKLAFQPQGSSLELVSGRIDAPHSNATLAGNIAWSDFSSANLPSPDMAFSDRASSDSAGANEKSASRLEISSSIVDLQDALAWFRAFHAGVLDRMSVQGFANVTGAVTGRPARIESFSLSSAGAELNGPGVAVPLRVGNLDLQYDADHFSLAPVTISLGSRATQSVGTFHVDASYKVAGKLTGKPAGKSGKARGKEVGNRTGTVRVAGGAAHARDLVAAAGSLGWNVARGWAVDGAFHCDLRWQGTGDALGAVEVWREPPSGTLDLGGAADTDTGMLGETTTNAPAGATLSGGPTGATLSSAPTGATLRAPFLNLPIVGIRVHADVKPGSRHVVVSSASAFGARWNGTFDWRDADSQWQFAMAADHLATADVDRWLNPRWRETFIERVVPFLNSRAARATPENLRASGKVNLAELTIGSLTLRNAQGALAINGRRWELTNASARFYGGEADGSAVATLTAVPSYRIAADFSGVDVASMAGASASLDGLISGAASGAVSFTARGGTRADLISSLQCDGSATFSNAEFNSLDLADSIKAHAAVAGSSDFSRAAASFSCADGKILVQKLSLAAAGEPIDVTGTIDFSRNLDLRLAVGATADTAAMPAEKLSEKNDAPPAATSALAARAAAAASRNAAAPAAGASAASHASATAASDAESQARSASPPTESTAWYHLSGNLAAPELSRIPATTRRGR